MNITQQLNEEQTTNRVAKGYEIFNQDLVEQINARLYSVKGKYEVEDLTTNEDINPVYQCSCPDFVYRHVQCSHIIAVQFKQMEL